MRQMARVVATHSGTFHCDEALACFLLLRTEAFEGARVVRTRDAQAVEAADAAVDVGGRYDAARHRYDHHQRGFGEVLGMGFGTRLSSAGLVYRHHGSALLARLAPPLPPTDADALYRRLYAVFVEHIDAVDNGVQQFDAHGPARYLCSTDLPSRVAALNPAWNDPNPRPDERFAEAMELVGGEFLAALRRLHEQWLPARALVRAAVEARHEVDGGGKLLLLPRACPWQAHLFQLEEELQTQPLQYVLFPDSLGQWRVQAVPVADGSFHCRTPLPEPWRGKRDRDLDATAAIDGCVFVHAAGFIGGHATQAGALQMARKALALAHDAAGDSQ